MSEHSPRPESLDSSKGSEQLKAPERAEVQSEVLADKQAEQNQQAETARAKLDQQPEPQASATEKEGAASTPHPTKIDKDSAYWDTLRSVQRHLGPAQRSFSKLIHAPAVEKTSQAVGLTVARPSVLLGATSTAAIVGGFFYLTARIGGFSLSGSEFILSLVVGGVLGLFVEAIAKLIKPRSQ